CTQARTGTIEPAAGGRCEPRQCHIVVVRTQCQELKGCNGSGAGGDAAGAAAWYATKLPLERVITTSFVPARSFVACSWCHVVGLGVAAGAGSLPGRERGADLGYHS